MLLDATGEPVTAVGDTFVVHMDREALNDFPMGKYDVTVDDHDVRAGPRDRVDDRRARSSPPIGHVYGYTLEPVDDGTLVTSYYDWSDIDPQWKRGEHLPDHPGDRAAGHARHPRPHRRPQPARRRRADQRLISG